MKKQSTESNYPAGVTKADTVRPKWDATNRLKYDEIKALGLEYEELKFYKVADRGWVILCLFIGGASGSRGKVGAGSDRYYAVSVDKGQLCSVGKGPHVLEELTVYVHKDNLERIQPLIDRYKAGVIEANTYRDRLSSRRLQGRIRNAERRSLWDF